MSILKAVETDRNGSQPRIHQTSQAVGVERQTVGHHPPGIAPAGNLPAGFLQIAAHEHLSAGKDQQNIFRAVVGRNLLIEHLQEIRQRHVRHAGIDPTVAAAVTARQITTQRTLPKERTQLVFGDLLRIKIGKKAQPDTLAQPELSSRHRRLFVFGSRSLFLTGPLCLFNLLAGCLLTDGLLTFDLLDRYRRTHAVHQADLSFDPGRIRSLVLRLSLRSVLHCRTSRCKTQHRQ